MADTNDTGGPVIDMTGTPRTQAEVDALNAPVPEPALSFGAALALAAGLVVAACIAAVLLPVAPAALFVLAAGLAVAYALDTAATAAWNQLKKSAPEVALPLLRTWNALPLPVQRIIRWSLWLIIGLVMAIALSRWWRGKGTRGPARAS